MEDGEEGREGSECGGRGKEAERWRGASEVESHGNKVT